MRVQVKRHGKKMTAWESLTSGIFEGGDILSQVVVADDGG